MRRVLWLLVAAALLPAAPTAAAQEAVGVDEQAIVAPAPVPEDSPTPTPTPAATTDPADPADTPVPGATPTPSVEQEQGNNAALQERRVKESEAEERCAQSTSKLLASTGSQRVGGGDSWAWLPFLIASVCAALVVGAYAIRRHRAPAPGGQAPPSLLEVVATIVAICAGVAGLAAQFVPGVGADDAPPPEAKMDVRSINARITREEFARGLGEEPPRASLDRREVGNVIWVQIQLAGFRGKRIFLQWGSYETKLGAPLVAATTHQAPIAVPDDSDELTMFQPVWVGYPSLRRFHVQFRLLDGREVREIAKTGPMRGDRARYACKRER